MFYFMRHHSYFESLFKVRKPCFDTIVLGLLALGLYVLAQGTVMLSLYYYVFLMSSYILKMFLLDIFGKSIIAPVESNLCFETAMKQCETL